MGTWQICPAVPLLCDVLTVLTNSAAEHSQDQCVCGYTQDELLPVPVPVQDND